MSCCGTFAAQSKSGFSLMNVMLGMAAISVLGVAVVTMVNEGMRASKTVEMNNEINELERELVGVLAVPASCQDIFGGNSSTNSTYATITDPVTGQDYPSGAASRYGDTQYSVQPYRISNAGLGNTGTLNGGGNGITNLVITVERNDPAATQKRIVGADTVIKNIRLNVSTAAGGNITECYATAQIDDVIWSRNPNDPSQIFYMDAVTIGVVANPGSDQLYVNGPIKAGAAGGSGGDITAQGRGFFSGGIESNDRIIVSTGDVTTNNGSFTSNSGGVTVPQNIETSNGNVRASGGRIVALNNIETTGGDLLAQGMLSVRGNGSIGGSDFWATSARGQFSQVTASGGVLGGYLRAGSGASSPGCNAGTIGLIHGGARIRFCDDRGGINWPRFTGYKVADGDPACVEGPYSISPGCGTGSYMREIRGCRLQGGFGPLTECKAFCCSDGSEGY